MPAATTIPLKLSAARYRAANDRPYLASALLSVVPVEVPGLGTLATDQWWRLYYDPATLDEWSLEELVSVIIHEIGHLIRDHCERFRLLGVDDFFKARLANLAGDAEINDDLQAEGFKLPGQPMLPSVIGMANGLFAEEYYSELMKKNPPPSSSPPSSLGSPGDSESGDGGSGSPSSVPPSSSGRRSGGSAPAAAPRKGGSGSRGGKGGGGSSEKGHLPADFESKTPGSGRCGSCSSGVQMPWEEGPPGENGDGTHGISKMEGEMIRRDVARKIIESSNTCGNIPAGWKRWAELKTKPQVDWRRQLPALVRSTLAEVSGAVDYSRRKPSRRQSIFPNIVMPSLRQPMPRIAIVLDTSGSMGDDRMSAALTETGGILKSMGIREGILVYSCDALVHSARKAFSVKDVMPLGGGGTDMRIGINAAATAKPRPHVIIVLTDAETPWPERCPDGIKVVIGLVGNGSTPPWAKVVRIDPKQHEKPIFS